MRICEGRFAQPHRAKRVSGLPIGSRSERQRKLFNDSRRDSRLHRSAWVKSGLLESMRAAASSALILMLCAAAGTKKSSRLRLREPARLPPLTYFLVVKLLHFRLNQGEMILD